MRAVAILLVLALSGCLGAAGPARSVDAFDAGASVLGLITDDELLPVAGALVRLAGADRAATTDEGGHFEILGVPAGEWTVSIEAPGHQPTNTTVAVPEGAEVELSLRLPRLGATLPYDARFFFEGNFDCAHEIPIWTGDCLLLYKAMLGQNDTQTAEKYHFRLPVDQGWESIVLELVWNQGPNNQLDGMRLYLENANGTDTGHSYKVGRTDGNENPLRLAVHRGQSHPRADLYDGTQTPAFVPDAGELAQIRVYPKGKLYKEMCGASTTATGDCYLGVGAGLNLDFTVYATVFYHARAEDGFSAVPDQ